MNFFSVLLCLVVPLLVVAYIPVDSDGVLILGDDNFDEAIASYEKIFINFYSPGHVHCQKLAPEYARAARLFSSVKFAKVDVSHHRKLVEILKVGGSPTLRLFLRDEELEYRGARTAPAIAAWVTKKAMYPIFPVSNEHELLTLQHFYPVVILGAFTEFDRAMNRKFLNTAKFDEILPFAFTTSPALLRKFGVSSDTVIVLKSFDDLRADLPITSTTTPFEISGFALAHSAPLVQEFTEDSAMNILKSNSWMYFYNQYFVFFTDENADHHSHMMETYRAAAASLRGRLLFLRVPVTEKRLLKYFQVNEAKLPVAMIVKWVSPNSTENYVFRGEHTPVAVQAFAVKFLRYMLSALLSEEVEESDTIGDVVILRGKSFYDLVIDNNKDVLVFIYSPPRCDESCEHLDSIFDELGATMKFVTDKVVIAKMNYATNDIEAPGVSILKFPTILLFKANDKAHPVAYEGNRELEDILIFLEKNFSRDEL